MSQREGIEILTGSVVVSKGLYELKTCLYHHSSLEDGKTTCVNQEKLAYKAKQHLCSKLCSTQNFRFSYVDESGNFHLLIPSADIYTSYVIPCDDHHMTGL